MDRASNPFIRSLLQDFGHEKSVSAKHVALVWSGLISQDRVSNPFIRSLLQDFGHEKSVSAQHVALVWSGGRHYDLFFEYTFSDSFILGGNEFI